MIDQNEERESGEADERKKYMMWATGNIYESLMKRKKGQHLSESQSHHIMQAMTEFTEDTKLIKTTYKLSISSNQNLIRKVKHRDVGVNKLSEAVDGSRSLQADIKSFIRSKVLPSRTVKSACLLKHAIFEEFGWELSEYKIRKILKNELKYSFKKGRSRPKKYTTDQV